MRMGSGEANTRLLSADQMQTHGYVPYLFWSPNNREIYLANTQFLAQLGGTCLELWHSEDRDRQISVNSKSTWSK